MDCVTVWECLYILLYDGCRNTERIESSLSQLLQVKSQCKIWAFLTLAVARLAGRCLFYHQGSSSKM